MFLGVATLWPVNVQPGDEEVLYFTSLTIAGPPIWVTLPGIFVAVALVMMGPAELVARCFVQLPRLDAYRFDLLGSLLGIGVFTLLAFLRAPPVFWGVLAVLTFLGLRGARPPWPALVPAAVVVAVLGIESLDPNTTWSPYYRVTTEDIGTPGRPHTRIDVNGVPHQEIRPVDVTLRNARQYGLPYRRADAEANAGDVLVIGAGNGNDVAIALSRGARHVDAVEIDPVLLDLGRRLHPDRPYDDPRVTSHIDDGRAYLQRTERRYDLILFALPDSLTLVPGASSLRLESYLMTTEALRTAKQRLRPGGAFAMYNYYRERWLIDRLAWTAATAFGHSPCVDEVGGSEAVITIGRTLADQRCTEPWRGPASDTPAPATDDRPFVYLKRRAIPALYLVTLVLLLLLSLAAVRHVGGPVREMAGSADLFLLGAAFLLLETKAVTSFALLFGTTWVVNAIVFGGVLLAVLCAVEVTRRRRTPPLPVLYGLVVGALALAWLVPNSALLSLDVPARLAAAVGIAFVPIFAANIVFAKRFAGSEQATVAFGANLLGAVLGGCLEYAALITGHSALLLVAGALYLAAFGALRLRGTEAGRRVGRAAAVAGPPVALVALWALMSSGSRESLGHDHDLYRYYAELIFDGNVPYRDFFVEYPPGSLAPIALAGLFGTGSDTFAVALEVGMVACLLAIQGIARALAGRHGLAVAWAVAFVPILVGPLARERIDLYPAVLLALGLWLVARGLRAGPAPAARPVLAGMAVLGVGAVTKVFPAAAALAVVMWLVGAGHRRLAGRGAVVFIVAGALVVVPFAVVGGRGFWDGATFQTQRPVQVESTPAMVLRVLGGSVLTGTGARPSIYRSHALEGGHAQTVAALFAALQAAALLAMAGWAWSAGRRRAPPGELVLASLAGVLAFISLGKVLSPQFLLWVAPLAPLAWVLGQRAVAVMLVVAAVLTQWEYPQHYTEVVEGLAPGVTVTAARNVLLVLAVGALLWAGRRSSTRPAT